VSSYSGVPQPLLTNTLAFLGQAVTVIMDRPLGSRHPRHGFLYLLNYGFIPDTLAPDGEAVDAYVLGVFEPIDRFVVTALPSSSVLMTMMTKWLSHRRAFSTVANRFAP